MLIKIHFQLFLCKSTKINKYTVQPSKNETILNENCEQSIAYRYMETVLNCRLLIKLSFYMLFDYKYIKIKLFSTVFVNHLSASLCS